MLFCPVYCRSLFLIPSADLFYDFRISMGDELLDDYSAPPRRQVSLELTIRSRNPMLKKGRDGWQRDGRYSAAYQLPLATRSRTTAPHDQDMGSRPSDIGSLVLLRSNHNRQFRGEFR